MDTSTQATELITVKGRSGTLPKRQYRPIEEKRRIVEETLVEGASVARVALSHGVNANQRSEEHTSELQSLTNLVCRLLLEKKKTRQDTKTYRDRSNSSG